MLTLKQIDIKWDDANIDIQLRSYKLSHRAKYHLKICQSSVYLQMNTYRICTKKPKNAQIDVSGGARGLFIFAKPYFTSILCFM